VRFVELCFHERDAIAANLAVKGLAEAGVCAIRRPVDDFRAPAVSQAATRRIVVYSPAFAALSPTHPAFAEAISAQSLCRSVRSGSCDARATGWSRRRWGGWAGSRSGGR